MLTLRKLLSWGAQVAQSVGRLILAQVMISRFMSPSLTSGSVLTAQSLEPASNSVSPSLSVPTALALCLSQNINVKKKSKKKERENCSPEI